MAHKLVLCALVCCVILFTTLCTAEPVAPEIYSVHPEFLNTDASTMITIVGFGFEDLGATATLVTISNITCPGLQTLNDETLLCNAEPGLGKDNVLKVVFDTQPALSTKVSFKAAEDVARCTGTYSEEEIVVDQSQVQIVSICGSNFGSQDVVADPEGWSGVFAVTIGSSRVPSENIAYHSDDIIMVIVPQDGAGSKQKVSVSFGAQTVVVANVVISYPGPLVSRVVRDDSFDKRSAQTVTHLIIYGQNFGTPPGPVVKATVGGFPCISLKHISSTELRCSVISGHGANRAVVVTVNGQSSAATKPLSVRYDFDDVVVPGLEGCVPPFGSADVASPEVCNCWSGYAPANPELSTECDVRAVCPGRITEASTVNHGPARPTTEFRDDKLFVKQTSPIVKNRRDTRIEFVAPSFAANAGTAGAATCAYPGQIWAKKVNNLDCLDEYYGVLPWSQHDLCGFVEDTSNPASPVRVFKSNLVSTYVETFKRKDGSMHTRSMSTSYLVSVTFQKQVKAISSSLVSTFIADHAAADSLEVEIVGDSLYDVATKHTVITFTTTYVWPYKISTAAALTGVWAKGATPPQVDNINAVATISAAQPGDVVCDQTQGTECEQTWVLDIDTQPGAQADPVCDLHGTITFDTGVLECRDYDAIAACDGTPSYQFSIKFAKTSLCDDGEEADASKGLTYSLEAYYDAFYTVPQAIFQTGDMVYFKLVVNDPTSTIDKITLGSLTVSSTSGSDTLFTNSGATLASATFDPTIFNVTQELRGPNFLPAGTNGEILFGFKLNRHELNVLDGLSTPNDMTSVIDVEATINIDYHGNDKRSVITSTTNSVPATAHSAISFYKFEDATRGDDELLPLTTEEMMEDNWFFDSSSTKVIASSVGALVVCVVAMML